MGNEINVTFDSTVYTVVLTSGNLALTPITPTPTPPTPPSPVSGMHALAMVYYGQHNSTVDAQILSAKPAILIDNTPAGLWKGNCNSATFQNAGITVFSYIYYNYDKTSTQSGMSLNEGLIKAIAAEGTKGVFIDCTNPVADPDLTTLCAYAHSLGLLVIVNPGESPADESLYAIADYVMVSEAYTNQVPTSTEQGKYEKQSIPIGFSAGRTAQQAAQYSNNAWAVGFPFTYSCQNYNQLPSWFTTYITLLNK